MSESFEQFWAAFPNKKGKGGARKIWEKSIEGDEELIKDIMFSIGAQKRYRAEAQAAGEFQPPWKHPSTWLNQECWDDEIKSHADLKEKINHKTCKCGKPADHRPLGLCWTCYDKKYENIYLPELRAQYRKNQK